MLRFYTGFDYYSTTQVNRIWPYHSGGTAVSPGRFGGQSWQWSGQSNPYLSCVIPNTTTAIMGMAFKMTAGDATNPIIIFADGTTSRTNPLTQVDIRVTTDAAFQATKNGSVLPSGTTSSNLFTFGFWNWVEVKATIGSSPNGAVEIFLNGTLVLNLSGVDTMYSGNNFLNMMGFQPSNSSITMNIDDLYIIDTVGSSPQNNFLGECRVQPQYPTSNGGTDNFAPFGAGSNYQCVDDTVMDDDTTYVKSGNVGDEDLYNMGSVALTGTIYGVQINVTARKDDVGNRTIAPVINAAGDYFGTNYLCTSDYSTAQTIFQVNPNGGALWTNTTVNAIQAGVKIVS